MSFSPAWEQSRPKVSLDELKSVRDAFVFHEDDEDALVAKDLEGKGDETTRFFSLLENCTGSHSIDLGTSSTIYEGGEATNGAQSVEHKNEEAVELEEDVSEPGALRFTLVGDRVEESD